MANPDNRRKPPGNINLDKGERSTNLEKEGAQGVELTPEEEAAQHNNGRTGSASSASRQTPGSASRNSGWGGDGNSIPPSSPDPGKKKGYGKAWLWVILAIVAVVIIIWIMPKGCTEAKEDQEAVALTETTANVSDSVTVEADSNVGAVQVASQEVAAVTDNSDKISSASAPAAKPTSKVSDNVEQEALNVIRGEYGNNPQRRSALGQDYDAVQRRVNQMMRSGKY